MFHEAFDDLNILGEGIYHPLSLEYKPEMKVHPSPQEIFRSSALVS